MNPLGRLDSSFSDLNNDKYARSLNNIKFDRISLPIKDDNLEIKKIEKISYKCKPSEIISDKSLNEISDKILKEQNFKKIFNSYLPPQLSNIPNVNKYGQTGLLSNFMLSPVIPEDLIATLPDEVAGKTDISELSMHSRRTLLQVVARLNTELFNKNYEKIPLLPKNKDEYCSLMQKLAESVSVQVLPVSELDIQNYYSAMKKLETILPDTDVKGLELSLKMPREIFIARVDTALSGLSSGEKRKIFDYFGFEINDGKLSGYPVNIDNKEAANVTNASTQKTIENVRDLVDKFTCKNRITLPTEQKPLEDALNDIVKVFPEYLTTVGKKQHGTHKYTLDIHLLKVLQETMKNPEYQKLTEEEKRIFNVAAFLHDIAKAEGEVDKSHPFESALDISYIVQKLHMPENEQERIVNIVKNHHWLEELSSVDKSDTKTLKSIAFSFRKPHDFSIAKIFAEADLKGVSDEFFESHKSILHSEQISKVGEYLDYLHETGIYFPQTRIPEASAVMVSPSTLGKGEEITNNVVVELEKCDDLRKYGFDSSELRAFVHVFDNFDIGTQTLRALEKEINEGVLSTSYINCEKFGTYYDKQIGVLLEADPANVILAGNSNLASGKKKGLKSSILSIFESKDRYNGSIPSYLLDSRTTFSHKIKEALCLNDEQYAELFQKLIINHDLSSIEDKKVRDVITSVADSYLRERKDHNEITILAPKIKGIFVKNKNANDVPYVLRKFAQDNDLPIIIFGDIP